MSKTRQLNELFIEWKQKHMDEIEPSYLENEIPKEMFLPDGIVDEKLFEESKERILIIGKELNWHYSGEGMLELNKKQSEVFWLREVAFGLKDETRFSRGLALIANAVKDNDYVTVNMDSKVFNSVAMINLNKRGGFARCIWKQLKGYTKEYKDFINKEISIIKPTIVIYCGTDVKWLAEKYLTVPAECKVITAVHPSCFAESYANKLAKLKEEMEKSEKHG